MPTGSGRLAAEREPRRRSLVTDLTNVRWLTGFTGSNASVAVLPDRLVLVTDGRYRDRAADELAAAGVEAEVVVGFTQSEQHDALVDAFAGIDAVGAEARHAHPRPMGCARRRAAARRRRRHRRGRPSHQGRRRDRPHRARHAGAPTPRSPRSRRCSATA